MPSGRFILFVVLIAAAGAFLAAYLFPIVKRWFLKYEHNVERRSKEVDREFEDDFDEDDKEDTKTYY